MAELTKQNALAEPALRRALRQPLTLEKRLRIETPLDKTSTVPPGRWLVTLRGFDVLELIGTLEAKRLLEHFSKGLANLPQTQEARRSLARLNKRLAAK